MLMLLILVTAIGLMALNVSGIESRLAWTNRRTTQSFHAAGGGADVALPVIRSVIENNAVPTYPSGSGVVVDNTNATGNPALADFVEELATGTGSNDTPSDSPPDITVTAFTGQTVGIDVDYAGSASLPGSELSEFASAYHKKSGGTGCASGNLYYVDAAARGPLNTQARVAQTYFHCP